MTTAPKFVFKYAGKYALMRNGAWVADFVSSTEAISGMFTDAVLTPGASYTIIQPAISATPTTPTVPTAPAAPTAPAEVTPSIPQQPLLGKRPIAGNHIGDSDRTAAEPSTRALIAKHAFVLFGIWEGRQDDLNKSLTAIRSLNPNIEFASYTITTELLNCPINSVTRSGNLVTVNTRGKARGRVATGNAGAIVIANSLPPYNGLHQLVAIDPTPIIPNDPSSGPKWVQFTLPDNTGPSLDDLDSRACYTLANDASLKKWNSVCSRNAWLRNAQGYYTQWTNLYQTYDINITKWVPAASDGTSFIAWKAKYDYEILFSPCPQISFLYSDNTFVVPRTNADWRRNGVDVDPKLDSEVAVEFRKGIVSYWDEIQKRNAALKIIGNVDSDLSSVEYKGRLDIGFLEGFIGASYSPDTYDKNNGFARQMELFKNVLQNTRLHRAILGIQLASPTNYTRARMGFVAANLLDGGMPSFSVGGKYSVSLWFDEFDAALGNPVAPYSITGPVWWRKFEGGVMLINPSWGTSGTVDVGTGYRHILGTQDPAFNNGASAQRISLQPRTAVVLVKQ